MPAFNVVESTTTLNFNIIDKYIGFSNDSTILNFELRTYNTDHPLYKILLDWIETFTVGDIF